MQDSGVTGTDLKATIEDYLDAFKKHETARCVDFYADDAVIQMATGSFKGRQAIEQFHQDRFNNDLQIYQVERVLVKGSVVQVDLVGSSKLARAWRFNNVSARATFTFNGGKIKVAKFGLRTGLPMEGW